MAALGRILQIVGWLWLIGGFIGGLIGFISLNLLPGIILVFVARVIRNQADTRDMPELGEQPSVEEQQRPPTPTAETPPQHQAPPSPEPYVLETPSRREPTPEPQPESKPAPRRRLLEEVAGLDPDRDDDASEETAMPSDQPADPAQRRPMSSSEMLARAHERWDSKDR